MLFNGDTSAAEVVGYSVEWGDDGRELWVGKGSSGRQ